MSMAKCPSEKLQLKKKTRAKKKGYKDH